MAMVVHLGSAPFPSASARADMPASPIWLYCSWSTCILHIKQNVRVRSVHLPSLKAWEQGSGAPAHRQVVQGPTGTSRSERRETDVPDLVRGQFELFKSWEGPLPQCVREGLEPYIANLVVVEAKHLHIAHQAKHLSRESAPAKSQGMGTRQPGASTPSSRPGPRSLLP